MKTVKSAVFSAAVVLRAAPAWALAGKVTPTQQVVNMMTGMREKGEKAMDEEQKTFAAYAEWADDKTKELGFEIKDGQAKIEELKAFIAKADSDVAELGSQIGGLDKEIDTHNGDLDDATQTRSDQNAAYMKMSKDYGESVDALKRAIQVTSAQNFDRAQAESLLQKMSRTVPGVPRVLAALDQEDSGAHNNLRGDGGAPDVAAYEFQSGGIVDLLTDLHDKFKKEAADTEENEVNQAHEFNLVQLHLTASIKKATSDREEKAVTKGKKAAASANAKGELAQTIADKVADEKLVQEMKTTLQAKTAAYDQNQKVRKEELEAISKAIEIMSGAAASGSYAKHINLVQVGRLGQRVPSFLQLSRSGHRTARQQAAAILSRSATKLRSGLLAGVADRMAANPFEKVIGMVEELLSKLKEEAAAEKEHKEWCDEQLKANKLKRNKKTAKVNMLTADIEDMTSDSAQLKSTIEKLIKEQAALTKAMSEATALRDSEKAENLATIADAKGGIEATGQALVILKEFYSGQEASFLQQKQVPEMAAYKGMQSGKGGVIGMLEVISSDFSRLKADTEASEKQAATEYSEFMEESTASKKQKHDTEFKLTLEKDQVDFETGETTKELRGVEKELSEAKKYYEQLKPACLEVHVSYEERVAQRKEEIEALKEAYAVLDQKGAE